MVEFKTIFDENCDEIRFYRFGYKDFRDFYCHLQALEIDFWTEFAKRPVRKNFFLCKIFLNGNLKGLHAVKMFLIDVSIFVALCYIEVYG